MSGVRMLHFLKDWWKFIQIHQYCTMALRIIYKLTLGYITLQTKMTLQYNMNLIFMIKWGPAARSTLYFSWTTTHVSLYPTVDIPQSQDISLNEYKQWITNSFPLAVAKSWNSGCPQWTKSGICDVLVAVRSQRPNKHLWQQNYLKFQTYSLIFNNTSYWIYL